MAWVKNVITGQLGQIVWDRVHVWDVQIPGIGQTSWSKTACGAPYRGDRNGQPVDGHQLERTLLS